MGVTLSIVSVGGVRSRTVTLNWPNTMFPYGSVAEQPTVVVAIAKVDPEAGAHMAGTLSTSFDANASNVTTAPDGPVASTTMSDGTESIGTSILKGTWSLTELANSTAPVYSAVIERSPAAGKSVVVARP